MAIAQKQGKSGGLATSYFDINQLELAIINRTLKDSEVNDMPQFIEIGRTKGVLKVQKRNLEKLCKGMKREHRAGRLEGELKRILSGKRRIPISCFMFGQK